MIRKRILTFLLVCGVFSFSIAGESIFGINDYSIGLLHTFYSGSGIGRSYEIAHYDSLRLNFMNFASWPNIANPTYGISLGYSAAFSKDGQKSDYFNDYINFQGGYLGIPILKKRLVMGFGLQPLSNVEQRFEVYDEGVKKHFLLKGGLSKGTLNLSYSFNRNFNLAIGYEYNFGRIDRSYRFELDKSEYPLTFEYQYLFYGHGMEVSAFSRPLENLSIGLVYRPGFTLRARIKPNTNSSIVNESKLKKLTIPAYYGFGLRYDFNRRTSIGSDLIYQDWQSGYKIESKTPDQLFAKYFRLGLGVERRQSHKLFTNFFQKMDYRAGIFYGQQNVLSAGNEIKEYGLSLGLSMPITRFRSRIDFSFLVGKRGALNTNQYEETFLKFGITINASEIWFVKFED